jgi:hypothetical protein
MNPSLATCVCVLLGVICVVLIRDLIVLKKYTDETCAILKKCRLVLQNTSGTDDLKTEIDDVLDTGDKVMARDAH